MNRRTFLKSIAMIGAAACVPAALVPKWKQGERDHVLRFKGIPIVYSEYAPTDTVYFMNVNGVHSVVGSRASIRQLEMRARMT